MSSFDAETVKRALTAVPDPSGRGNLVSSGRVSGISISGRDVSFVISVDRGQGPALEPLRQAAQAAVEKIDGVGAVLAVLTSERAPPPAVTSQKSGVGAGTHKISSRPVAPLVRHIVAVASGKGGVGKSTVAANLALSFAALGKKAGLLDADIYGSSQPRMMGIRQKPETDDKEMIRPLTAHGVKLMSMGFFVEPDAPVIWRGPMVHSALQQLLRDVDWGDLDILVIDLPPGTGDIHLSLAQHVPVSGAVIVSTPQEVALSEARKGIRMFEKTGVPVLGMVENMSYHACSSCGHREHIFSHGGVARAAQELRLDLLGEIPLDLRVRERADGGTPIVVAEPGHPVARAFLDMAARLWVKLPEKTLRAAVN